MSRVYTPLIGFIRQTAYRIYNDDGSLQAASPRAAENTPTTAQPNQNTRIRIEIKNEDLDPFTLHALLEYNLNNTGWEPCTTTGNIRIVNSTHYNTGDPTLTDRLATNTGNYTQGQGVDTQASAGPITLNAGQHTECEWNIALSNLNDGDVVQFRVVALPSAWNGDPNNYNAGLLYYDHYATLVYTTQGGSNLMAETVTNLTRFGIAVASDETKAYKAVALLDVVSCDLAPRVNRVVTMPGRGSLAPRRALTAQVWCEGSLTCETTPNHLPYLLLLAGYAPTTTGASAPYTHTFTLGSGLPTKSGTLVAYHENGTPPTHEVYAGLAARRISLDYNAEAADTLQITLDLLGLIYGVSNTTTLTDLFASATPPADADPPFVQPITTVEMPTSTTLNRVVRASVNIDLQRDLRWTLRGRVFPHSHQPIRAIRVTGSLTLVFETDADVRRFLNQGAGSPIMHADNPSANTTSLRLIASNNLTGNALRRLTLSLPSITFTSMGTPKRRDEIVTLDTDFEAVYDAASSSVAQIIVENAAPGTTYSDATATITGLSL